MEDAVGTVAVVTPGVPPAAFAEMGDTLQQMKPRARRPMTPRDVFATASKDAAAAAAAITKYDVGTKIDDKGFVATETIAFTDSSQQIVQALVSISTRHEVGEGGGRVIGA